MRMPSGKGCSSELTVKQLLGIRVQPSSQPYEQAPCPSRVQDPPPRTWGCPSSPPAQPVPLTSKCLVSVKASRSPVQQRSSRMPTSWGCMFRSPPSSTTSAAFAVCLQGRHRLSLPRHTPGRGGGNWDPPPRYPPSHSPWPLTG